VTQHDALLEFLQVVLAVLVKYGRPEDQRRLLDAWSVCYEALTGDER
jgi:hypothetical protein